VFNTIGPTTRLETAKRFLSFLMSVALHGIVLAALIVIPLIFFSVLPDMELLTFLIAAPPPPLPPPPPPPVGHYSSTAVRPVVEHGTFTEPPYIPPNVPPPGSDEPPIVVLPLPGSANLGGTHTGTIGFQPESLGLLKPVPPPVIEPPPPPSKKPPMKMGGDVLQSKLVKKIVPEYPPLAKQARVSGSVVLQVNVDEDGNVVDIRVLSGHPLLEEAAVGAVRQWKYSPTLLNGEPVPVVATVTVVFNLK